jgi:histone deacetylase complex subunit SAP18
MKDENASDNESQTARKPLEREQKEENPKLDQALSMDNKKKKFSVDREKTCPFMVRLFCRDGAHHPIDDISSDKIPKENEMVLYCWYFIFG